MRTSLYLSSYVNRQTDRINKMEKTPNQNKTKTPTYAPT